MQYGGDPDTRRRGRAAADRERQTLVGEQTRLVDRIKAILARFGIRSFRLSLRNAADRLMAIRVAEGTPLPDNTRAELHRLLERRSGACADPHHRGRPPA
ncbi:hypothetical protein [Mesorhizobium sp. L103C119B0]|uniref:hypothetical protein n=1 Tax=Mesorhizobium sp. L103C119B0 TaxID=1287085 RepID=UPI0012DD7EE6|nr:hypothetical protein [Mesorhizobium sp. L103C119B0]